MSAVSYSCCDATPDLSGDFDRLGMTLKVSVSPAFKKASVDMMLNRYPAKAPEIITWLMDQVEANAGHPAFEQIKDIALAASQGWHGTDKEVTAYCNMINRLLRKEIDQRTTSSPAPVPRLAAA